MRPIEIAEPGGPEVVRIAERDERWLSHARSTNALIRRYRHRGGGSLSAPTGSRKR